MIEQQERNGARVFLDAAAILALDDRPIREVWVEPWQTWVRMRDPGAYARHVWSLTPDARGPLFTASAVALCAITEDGARLFTDVTKLAERNSTALDVLFPVAADLLGLGPRALEDAKGNSEPSPRAATS